MLLCLFRLAMPVGRPITVVPLKQRAGSRVGHSRTQRPAGPSRCEAASTQPSSSESTMIAAPSADRGPYRITCENPWVRLRRTTVPRTQPSPGGPGQQHSTVLPSKAGPVATSAGLREESAGSRPKHPPAAGRQEVAAAAATAAAARLRAARRCVPATRTTSTSRQ